jgi:Transposase DDE domain
MGVARSAPVSVDLVRILELLRTHITAALCQTVFATVRVTERQRRWTLQALVEFWLAVILRAPRALSQALYETLEGSEPLFPLVEATPEAFFQRCQRLRPAFFAAIFARFTAGLLPATPLRYAQELAEVQARFAGVVVVDGSRLAALAHRLKLLWAERAVVLPGCLLAVYDLGRGLCRSLDFCADAAAGELARAQAALRVLPRDTLVLADRLYGNGVWFATLAAHGCWGLVRQNRRLGLRKRQCLTRRTLQGGRCTDWLVETGGTRRTPPQRLRYIRWQRGASVRAVLTNVLDPARLSAPEALALYGQRWTIERLFFDLKEVLNLNRVYAGNPNAIAMQVYAAGCVYNALRVAQAEVAEAAGLAPEAVSPAKFFPKMAAACHCAALFELWFLDTQTANRGRRLRKPPVQQRRFAQLPLAAILVEARTGPRRKRRFCKARRKWKSFTRVRGGRKLLKLS